MHDSDGSTSKHKQASYLKLVGVGEPRRVVRVREGRIRGEAGTGRYACPKHCLYGLPGHNF